MVTKRCFDCGKSFLSRPSAMRRFCSRRCYFIGFGERQRGIKNPFYKTGLGASKFYNIWRGILKRCNNKTHKSYPRYGGRGIKVLWESFEDFRNDMYESYLKHQERFGGKNTTIDRIDNDKHYYRKNCRWATWKQQAVNRNNKDTIMNLGKYYVKKGNA